MSRLAGLLILLLIVLIMFPPVRERLRPYAQPVLDPIYEYNARNRVKTLAKRLQEEESLGRSIPSPEDFGAFVDRRDMQQNASIDPWGNPYYLRVQRTTYYVGSAGRDQVEHTEDDIVSETFERRNESRRRR